ncbi:MAG: hypothetical protein LBH01_08900 [Verrucomicrobiales bacterium]|jgi:hypothetical protein|nr:hypothetical protein [Verrucomicrobiales bacterium]
MNKRWVLFELKEALEQLTATISEIQNKDYDVETFRVHMGHAYHHLNTAWNAKDCTDAEHKECTQEKF